MLVLLHRPRHRGATSWRDIVARHRGAIPSVLLCPGVFTGAGMAVSCFPPWRSDMSLEFPFSILRRGIQLTRRNAPRTPAPTISRLLVEALEDRTLLSTAAVMHPGAMASASAHAHAQATVDVSSLQSQLQNVVNLINSS